MTGQGTLMNRRLRSSDNSGRGGGLDGFDEDGSGEFGADAEPGVAHLADEIGVAAHQPDLLLFAEAELPQAIRHIRGSGKMLDANGRAGLDLVQRAKLG